jgi:hypothetical protein
MKLKTLLLTILISTSLIGTAQALTFVNSNSNSSKSTQSTKVDVAKSGISIENDPNKDWYSAPVAGFREFMHKEEWRTNDFNNDGYADFLYIGGMKYETRAEERERYERTGHLCGGGHCLGPKQMPELWLGTESGRLVRSGGVFLDELLIDNREDPGLSLGKGAQVADYNNDGVLDFYINDHGTGGDDGWPDSYYLSQPNGTWLESSDTHLSHSNFMSFSHGGTTGDIDGDGDMDVVITYTGPKSHNQPHRLMCWMNDGKGFLKKRGCGGHFAFAIELGDMDGDGDLDLFTGGLEKSECKHCMITGIIWNDGRGNFSKHNTTHLPQHGEVYFNIPEASMSDLDGDGDLDIVLSRAGHLYGGTAVSIIENLGSRKFKSHGIIEVLPAPEGYVASSEANPWNNFIISIKFRDLDEDGDMDVFLHAHRPLTNGTVLLNNGGDLSNFELLMPHQTKHLISKKD